MRLQSLKRARPHLFALCAVAATLLSGFHFVLQNALVDLRYRLLARQASGDIVLVAIDSRSLDELGVWPWPRSNHAALIRRLTAVGVKDIAFDVDFSSHSTPQQDLDFLNALRSAGGAVVLPTFQQSMEGFSGYHLNEPLPEFSSHSWPAAVNVRTGSDSLVRQYWTSERIGHDRVAAMAAVLAHRQDPQREPFLIDFGILPQSIPVIPYVDVLRGLPEALHRVAGKSVIVGGTAIELGDRFSIPLYGVVSGPVLQALAAESLLQHRDLHLSSPFIVLAGLCLLLLIMIAVWQRASALTRIVLLANLAAIVELVAILVQDKYPIVIETSLFHVAVGAYLVALALDEIDIRGLLRRVAESRFQRFANSIGDGLVCADAHCHITTWNPSAARIFGYRAEEMIGGPIDLIWGVDGECVFTAATLDPEKLRRPGGYTVEISGRRSSGETFPIEVCFSGWDTPEGLNFGAVIRDISARKREEFRIRYLAEHDTLTGLLNRDAIYRLAGARKWDVVAHRHELALLIVAASNFNRINDTFGNACGDELLFGMAARLNSLVRDTDLLARLGGDEFGILLSGHGALVEAEKQCTRIAETFKDAPLEAAGRQHRIAPVMGAAVFPRDCYSVEELFGCAHMALDRAKALSSDRCVFFDAAIRDEIQAHLTLESELARAAAEGEFELFYQPQARISDTRLAGVEALIRWRHPQRGLILPSDFMPVANKSAISDQVAAWVIETACRQGAAWERRGHNIRVAVNLSSSLIQSGKLVVLLKSILADTGLSPWLLEIEVTEDIILTESDEALALFRQVQDLGVRIVFDDFGTGYASLSYLRKFPLDGLKIDRSFVAGIRVSPVDAAIVDCTINLAKSLGLSVIAEGIEDAATALLLAKSGCDEGQGFLFGKPMPVGELEEKYNLASVAQPGRAA